MLCEGSLSEDLLVMKHAMRAQTHAVDGPLGVAVLVADGDGEATVVGPDQVDDVVAVAAHVQRRTLASVRRPVLRSF